MDNIKNTMTELEKCMKNDNKYECFKKIFFKAIAQKPKKM